MEKSTKEEKNEKAKIQNIIVNANANGIQNGYSVFIQIYACVR